MQIWITTEKKTYGKSDTVYINSGINNWNGEMLKLVIYDWNGKVVDSKEFIEPPSRKVTWPIPKEVFIKHQGINVAKSYDAQATDGTGEIANVHFDYHT